MVEYLECPLIARRKKRFFPELCSVLKRAYHVNMLAVSYLKIVFMPFCGKRNWWQMSFDATNPLAWHTRLEDDNPNNVHGSMCSCLSFRSIASPTTILTLFFCFGKNYHIDLSGLVPLSRLITFSRSAIIIWMGKLPRQFCSLSIKTDLLPLCKMSIATHTEVRKYRLHTYMAPR